MQMEHNSEQEQPGKLYEEIIKLKKENEQYKGMYEVLSKHATNLEEDLECRLKQLNYVTHMDSMTGILNRRSFIAYIKEGIEKARRDTKTLSVIMYDVDGFNTINDMYGHDAGDAILIKTVNVVKKHLKEKDIFARWGGDKFILMLPDISFESAFYLAEKAKDEIATCKYWIDNEVTCSFGVTVLLPDDDDRRLIIRAERALRRAKSLGKNRVGMIKE
jgi:diguanylate cyclase (GGDEF)-like protein